MPKLNQVIALSKGKKSEAERVLTDAYHAFELAELFEGHTRLYQPKAEDGETQPPEGKRVQRRVDAEIRKALKPLSSWIDVTSTQENANATAAAEITVNGEIVVPSVPVTVLLFLEKRLVDLRTFVRKMPVLDPSVEWTHDGNTNLYRGEPVVTNRTKKVPVSHVKYEATKEHPAQVEVYPEDRVVGEWTTTRFSGAISQEDKDTLLDRIGRLQEAIKKAREQANSIDAPEVKIADSIMTYLFDVSPSATPPAAS